MRGNLAQWHQLITTADERVQGNPWYEARLNQVKRYYLYLIRMTNGCRTRQHSVAKTPYIAGMQLCCAWPPTYFRAD